MSYNWFINGTTTLRKRFFNRKEFNEMKIALASSDVSNIVESINQSINGIRQENFALSDKINNVDSTLSEKINDVDSVLSDKIDNVSANISILNNIEIIRAVEPVNHYHKLNSNNGGAIIASTYKTYAQRNYFDTIFLPQFVGYNTRYFVKLIKSSEKNNLDWDYFTYNIIIKQEYNPAMGIGDDLIGIPKVSDANRIMKANVNTRLMTFQWSGFGSGWVCINIVDYQDNDLWQKNL